jgi:hypothetical protein
VKAEVQAVASEEGIDDADWINDTWTGRTLTALRFRRSRVGKGRGFVVPVDQLRETARAYGLLRAPPRPAPPASGPGGDAGPAGQGDGPAAGAVAHANRHPPGNSVISGFSDVVSPPGGAACAEAGCPNPGIPDPPGPTRCAEHHLAAIRARRRQPMEESVAAAAATAVAGAAVAGAAEAVDEEWIL